VYLYSGQRLNTGDWQQTLLLRRLAKDKAATFTRGPEYNSLTVSLVDAEEEARKALAATRGAWKTKEGFVYPPKTTWAEDVVHPQRPPQSRVDALAQKWVDPNELMAVDRARRQAAEALPGHEPFRGDYVEPAPLKQQRGQFGYVGADGSQQMLEFLQSVHPTGVVLEAQQREDRVRAAAAFREGLVVDETRFRHFESHDGMAKVNRVHSLLRDAPQTKSLQMTSSGKALVKGQTAMQPYVNNPVSMDTALPFTAPLRDKALLRELDASRFVGVDKGTGRTTDFKGIAARDVVHGTAKALYKPAIEAGVRPTAVVGERPQVPRVVQGINTDGKFDQVRVPVRS
jgi:hypothetical protein